jgi:hypothetical protein
MLERHLFEYAVIRVVPRVEREEFINAGIILYCAKLKFLRAAYHLDSDRLSMFCADLNIEDLEKNLEAFVQICMGTEAAGPIAKLDAASRFRWLTATRSTVLQTSKVHPGFCLDPTETIEKLKRDLVL